ncbi:MAG: hypothetical protein KIT11_00460 [Fimbriimonadaceae bacterium]|nr:hypothetical protein [Fimbriimonadaceae bacterium]QYK55155.1 MAG: hypothetical protein KF733_09075 [Fimbriimonadaceae bacterium]
MAKGAPGALVSDVAGQVGGIVVVNGAGGLVFRRPPRFRRVLAPTQRAAAERMRQVSAVWQELGHDGARAWDDYAATVVRLNRLTGGEYRPSGFNAFCALGTKVLQVDPTAEVPVAPPSSEFTGDPVTFTVSVAEALSTPPPYPLPKPGSSGSSSTPPPCPLPKPGEGVLVVQASGPNLPGSVTEILLERLPNVRRKPTGRFASAAFHRFEPGALSYTLPVEPGVYVVATRFVRAATGQQTGVLVVGRVSVASG